jgi:hypothetical protein
MGLSNEKKTIFLTRRNLQRGRSIGKESRKTKKGKKAPEKGKRKNQEQNASTIFP